MLGLFGEQANEFRTKDMRSLAESRNAEALTLLTAKLTYFHGFLTFTDREYTCEM